MIYSKPPITYKQQVEKWEKRGLQIPDKHYAEDCLARISYYRLSAYALPFQSIKDKFDQHTSIDTIINLYDFDSKLRFIVLKALEKLEIAIRTQIIYNLSHKYGSHWQENASIFIIHNGTSYVAEIFKITDDNCKNKNPEVFIKHYLDNYTQPSNPPSWMIIELFTLGQLSKLYSNLKFSEDKRLISGQFGLHHSIFKSWFHTLTYVRNICAHHSRLWNREFLIRPDLIQKPKDPWIDPIINGNNRTFYFLCILKYLLNSIEPSNNFKQSVLNLFIDFPAVPIQYMGIPFHKLTNWQNEPLWKN